MKLHEVKSPSEGDHPILFALIQKWLRDGVTVEFDSAGLEGQITDIGVDVQKQKPIHGQVQTYKMEYRAYGTMKSRSKGVPGRRYLSNNFEATWLYPAELEDAKITKEPSHVKLDIPDYVNNSELLKDRK